MKIDNSHIFNIDSVRNNNGNGKLYSSRGTKPSQSFTVPEPDNVFHDQKNPVPVETANDLNKLLSAEEKQLFEQLFPVAKTLRSNRPVRAYSVQQQPDVPENSGTVRKNILGNHLDIKG